MIENVSESVSGSRFAAIDLDPLVAHDSDSAPTLTLTLTKAVDRA